MEVVIRLTIKESAGLEMPLPSHHGAARETTGLAFKAHSYTSLLDGRVHGQSLHCWAPPRLPTSGRHTHSSFELMEVALDLVGHVPHGDHFECDWCPDLQTQGGHVIAITASRQIQWVAPRLS